MRVVLGRRRGAVHLGAVALGDLRGGDAHPAGGGVHQHPLAAAQAAVAHQPRPGGGVVDGDGGALLERHLVGQRHHVRRVDQRPARPGRRTSTRPSPGRPRTRPRRRVRPRSRCPPPRNPARTAAWARRGTGARPPAPSCRRSSRRRPRRRSAPARPAGGRAPGAPAPGARPGGPCSVTTTARTRAQTPVRGIPAIEPGSATSGRRAKYSRYGPRSTMVSSAPRITRPTPITAGGPMPSQACPR